MKRNGVTSSASVQTTPGSASTPTAARASFLGRLPKRLWMITAAHARASGCWDLQDVGRT